MLIDTHCHLFMDPLYSNVEGVLTRAFKNGVRGMVVPSVELESWEKVRELADNKMVFPALGLHPWYADEKLDTGTLEKLLIETDSVAIGEIGLDFKIENPDRTIQIAVFRTQLNLAAELDLPVIIHCRGAFDEMLSILSENEYDGRLKGVIHAFTRGPQLAERFLELGFYLAFGGGVTRPRAKRARKSAASVPLNRILLETDAPSIGMDGVEPERVEPADVERVCSSLAQLRGITFEEAARATTANARELFGIAQ